MVHTKMQKSKYQFIGSLVFILSFGLKMNTNTVSRSRNLVLRIRFKGLDGVKFKCNVKFNFFPPGTLAEELSTKNNQTRDVTGNTQAGSRVFTFAPMCRMVIPFSCVTLAWQGPGGFPLLHSFSDRTDLRRNGTWQTS